MSQRMSMQMHRSKKLIRRRRPIVIVLPQRRSRPAFAGWLFVAILFLLTAGWATSSLAADTVADASSTPVGRPACAAGADGDDPLPVDRAPDGRRLSPSARSRSRRGSRRRQELDREREERRRRTEDELDRIHAEYWEQAGSKKSWPIGTAYARFSTRFQESIGDQIRKILEFALANQIRVPRHLILYDLAVRGVTNRRAGLDQVRSILRTRKATVLLLFATNRLFRKTYRTLEFVDMVFKELRARCIFVMTGIDTNNKDQWEQLLHLHALMDQFVVRSGVAHIHAAHEGMLERKVVCGTLSYGYTGKPIDGELTKLGRPRREIVVDQTTAPIVRQIFRWFVEDRVDVIEIIRRLKADPAIPRPPHSLNDDWSRGVVRAILKNPRYRAQWRYGANESVFLPEADYVRQRPRPEPLKEVQLEELRIVDDVTWHAAQERLAEERGTRRGRPPKDGDHASRPKLLNGLLVCPQHDDQVLYVGGPHGNAMVCPLCRAMPASERPLYSVLNRRLATRLLIDKLVELLLGDRALIEQSLAVCREAAESAQRPDPQAAQGLRQKLAQLVRSIDITRRTVGDEPADQEEAQRTIRELQGEAAGVRANLARLEAADRRVPRVPTETELTTLLSEARSRLLAAVESKDPETIAQARRILELLTGGRIALEQEGRRAPKRGWLSARFRVRLLSLMVHECGAEVADDEGVEVKVDFRAPSTLDAEADRAWRLYQEGALHLDIAKELKRSKAKVMRLLKYAAAQRGVPYEDGRSRRSNLSRKHRVPPLFERMAPEVGRLVDEGLLLAEIGERLKLDSTTLTKAYNKYRADRGLPPLDGRSRRKTLDRKNRPRDDEQ